MSPPQYAPATIRGGPINAVLVTPDHSNRRRHPVIGRHLWLECNEWEAADQLKKRLPKTGTVVDPRS